MKKFNFSKLLMAVALTASLVVLGGCKPTPDEAKIRESGIENVVLLEANDPIIGTWKATDSEKYIITNETFEALNTYKGNELFIKKNSDTEGYIYVKYTNIPDWNNPSSTEPADKTGWVYMYGSWYPTNEALLGKWYAIYYSDYDKNNNSIKITGAYKAGGVKGTSTLAEAVEEFQKSKGYFGTPSACTKE